MANDHRLPKRLGHDLADFAGDVLQAKWALHRIWIRNLRNESFPCENLCCLALGGDKKFLRPLRACYEVPTFADSDAQDSDYS